MDNVFDHLIPLVVAAVMPFVLLVVHKLVAVVAAKLHINNVTQYQYQLDALVTTAVQGLEKKAMTALDQSATVMTGQQKLQAATDWINKELGVLGLPPVAPDQLAMRIESMLFEKLTEIATNAANKLEAASDPTQAVVS